MIVSETIKKKYDKKLVYTVTGENNFMTQLDIKRHKRNILSQAT